MAQSYLKLIVASILLTSLVFYSNTDYGYTEKTDVGLSKRNLFTQSDFDSLCTANLTAPIVQIDINNTQVNAAASGFASLISNLSFVKTDQSENIRGAIIDGNKTAVANLVIGVAAPYIIVWVLFIITIIAWIICWSCCCCRCKCCSCFCCVSSDESKSNCCSLVSFILIAAGVAGVIAICIIGFVVSKDVPKKLDAGECTLMKTFLDIKDGDKSPMAPRWIGVNPLDQKLGDISNSLDTVKNNYKGFPDTSYTSTDYNNYKTLLTNSYNNYSPKTTRNPNPASTSSNFSPFFISNYGPYDTISTTTGVLSTEFSSTIVQATNLLNQLSSNSDTISRNIDTVKSMIQDTRNSIKPLLDHVNTIDTDYIDKFRTFKSDSAKPLSNFFLALFAVSIGLAILFLLWTVMFGCCGIKFSKYILHVLWNIINLITIPIYIIAGVFGLMGTAMLYLGTLINVMFSPSGLAIIFPNNTLTVQILDTCMNKDGNIYNQIFSNSGSTQTTSLTSFINNGNKLKQIRLNITNINGSPAANQFSLLYKNMSTNIALEPNVLKTLKELTTYTSYADKTASKQADCSSNTYDLWTSLKEDCPADIFVVPAAPANNVGSNSCLNVRDWKSSDVAARYKDRPNCPSQKLADVAGGYVTSLNNYASDAADILISLQTEMTK